METEGLSVTCAGLGIIEEDENGNITGYSKGEYCLDNLKDLLRFLRRDDPQTRDVFKQVCKWNIVSKDLIPIIEYCQEDRNLLLNAVKVLVFLTMPIEPTSTDISQQLEYLWELKSSITNSDVVAVIVLFLEGPLENLESDAFTEDDWKLVQLVLTLIRNILAVQEIPLQQKSGGSASQLLSLRDRFQELLFRESVMDIILVITHYVGGSSVYLRQDNLLLLEIFHYIFMGQEPELIVRAHLDGLKVDEDSQMSLNSLKSFVEEEERMRSRLNNMNRHSQFSGTFARLTMDGSKAVIKGNPNSSRNILKTQNVTRGPAKKVAWDYPKLPPTKDKILELLHGFVNQFLSGGYNVLMQSIREDIEKEHPAIQKSDVVMFFQVAEFATSFQFYKYSASKRKNEVDMLENHGDKKADSIDFNGQICGPIAVTMNEAMFQLVISEWRHAFDGLKETNNFKFLSAAGSLMKKMIHILDLILQLFPEDFKEPQTARILLYKLFYDQTAEGMTQFLLNLMKTFDAHKQPKSDLADLVEIIHKVVKLMEKLQTRGTLRVSRKSRKVKKKIVEGGGKGCKPFEDHSGAENEIGISIPLQLHEKQPSQKEYLPNKISGGEEDNVVPDNANQHEKNVKEDENTLGGLTPIDNKNCENANEDLLCGTSDFSGDELLTATDEVDFKVSTLISALANHNVVQKVCWLLKFYKSNSLATNHYIICILRRISEDLELQPMLYQLSLLTTFYDILVEQKTCPCEEYANIVDFLTNLVRKMLKKMKKQPLLFVEVLFWKTRRECHYINAEYLLNELGYLKKQSGNWDCTHVDGETASSPAKLWTRRSIADALGEDEADTVITHDLGYQKSEENLDADEPLSTSSNQFKGEGIANGVTDLQKSLNSKGNLLGQHLQKRKRVHAFSEDQEALIRALHEQFKGHRRCSYMIAKELDVDGKFTPRQVSRKLKQLGLSVPQKKSFGGNMLPKDEDLHETSTDREDESDDVTLISLVKSLVLDVLIEHMQEATPRCMLYADDIVLVGDSKEEGLYCFKASCDNSMFFNWKKMENSRISSEEIQKQSCKEKLSKDHSDDDMLSSVLKYPKKANYCHRLRHAKLKDVFKVSWDARRDVKTCKSRRVNHERNCFLLRFTLSRSHRGIPVISVGHCWYKQPLSPVKYPGQEWNNFLLISRCQEMTCFPPMAHLHGKTGRSLKSMSDERQTIRTRETFMDNDSLNGGTTNVLEAESRVRFSNTHQVEHQEVDDELVDSEDDVVTTGFFPDNAVSRRKLRMVIDPEEDD
ncbi:protein timeless-like protein isoform X1 [Senna tora]|uniref:Protein timeless-like protein isoform X1 n=1 Tax=Senna tora TaxID=362788 RepID=A0A834THJ4_9FABA|nr:protein timeless-like protein isoform X1 [Senna tora]